MASRSRIWGARRNGLAYWRACCQRWLSSKVTAPTHKHTHTHTHTRTHTRTHTHTHTGQISLPGPRNSRRSNLVVAADEVDDVAGSVGQYSDSAAVDERRQRLVDVDLSPRNGEHDVNALLGHLLWQLADRRVVLRYNNCQVKSTHLRR